jgi:hypothetical protein
MSKLHKSFDEFIEDAFFKTYDGIKDDFEDSLAQWRETLDVDQVIELADLYGMYVWTEAVKRIA